MKGNLEHALSLAARLPQRERVEAEVGILDELIGVSRAALGNTAKLLRDRAAKYELVDVEIRSLVEMAYPLAWSSSERSLEVIDQALRLIMLKRVCGRSPTSCGLPSTHRASHQSRVAAKGCSR